MSPFALRQGRFKNLRLPIMASGMIITILVATLYLANLHPVRLIENRLYDLCLQISLSNKSNGKPDKKDAFSSVIVDIDEYSLSQFGQWPWPRYHVAKLLHKIHDAGAIAVGIDILFAEPDRTSPVVIQKALKNDFNIDVTFSNLPDSDAYNPDLPDMALSDHTIHSHELMDNDLLLAQAITKTSATLGYYFNFQHQNPVNRQSFQNVQNKQSEKQINHNQNGQNSIEPYLPPLSANISFEPGSDPSAIYSYLFKALDSITPIPVLLNGVSSAGFMNTLADDDGVLRRTPLFISWNDRIYPQLALATFLESMQNLPLNRLTENISTPLIKTSSSGVESITVNGIVVPLEYNSSILLNYRGPSYTFPYISAARLLENTADKKILKGKIVFLGSSAAGLKDIRISPLDKNFPGVEVHATIVDNILKGDFISRPDWTPALEFILTIGCGFITTLLIGLTGTLMTLVLTIMTGISIFIAGLWSLDTNHIWISPLFPLLTLSANFAILNLVKYELSEKDKKFYRTAFGHYVSKSVVNQIIESPETFNLDGEEKEITILFADIRNFSSISETLSPSQVSRLLHDYFTPVTRIIISHQGTLDKFIGDAIMCFWNAPITVKNHKSLALNAAIRILETLEELSIYFEKEYGVIIKTGIGLHSGVCRVGNMGSADLFDYTAIGDHVNIASRLEGLTKFYGVELIFSESMIPEKREDILIQYVDRVRVKGKTEPINIYTSHWIKSGGIYDKNGSVIMSADPSRLAIEKYHYAIELYKNRDFARALKVFSELEEIDMQDLTAKGTKTIRCTKLYSIYKERTLQFIDKQPDKEWDCVYNHTTK